MKTFRDFFKEEEGMGTVEILLIIAVLICIVLIFRKAIVEFVTNAVSSIFGDASAATNTTTQAP